MYKIISTLYLLCFILIVVGKDVTTINIIATNDIHGNLNSEQVMRMGSIIGQERAKDKDTILVDTGDIVTGTYVDYYSRGMASTQFLNDLKYDFWVPGNHDFDRGISLLLEQISHFNGKTLISNLDLKGEKSRIEPFAIRYVKGLKIAFVGLTFPTLNRFKYEGENFEIFDLKSTIAKVMPKVKKMNPDIIVLLTHFASNSSAILKDIATANPEIDLIIMGHTHKVISTKIGVKTWASQAGYHSKGVSSNCIVFDNQTRKVSDVKISYHTDPQRDNAKIYQISERLKRYNEEAEQDSKIIVGYTEKKISSEDDSMAKFFVDIFLNATHADIAIISPPKKKAFFEKEVTKLDIFNAYPFEQGGVVVVDLTRKELITIILEQYNAKKTLPYGFSVNTTPLTKELEVTLPLEKEHYKCAITGQLVRRASTRNSQLFKIINSKKEQPTIIKTVSALLYEYIQKKGSY